MLALAAPQIIEWTWPSIVDQLVLVTTVAHPKSVTLLVASSAEVRKLCTCFNVL
jgi:hypothetical protein